MRSLRKDGDEDSKQNTKSKTTTLSKRRTVRDGLLEDTNNQRSSPKLNIKFSELKTSRLRLQYRDYTLSLTSSLPSSKHPKDGYLGRGNYILYVTRLFNIRTPYCTSIMLQLGRYHHTTVPEKVIMVLIPIPTRSR